MNHLSFHANISADFLARVSVQIEAVIFAKLMGQRKIREQKIFHQKVRPALVILIRILSLLMIVLGIFLLLVSKGQTSLKILDLSIMAFALMLLWLFKDLTKLDKKIQKFNDRALRFAARKRAFIFIKRAEKLVPFVAEYDLRGPLLVYYRTKNEESRLVWNRQLHGIFLTLDGFTLLFKRMGFPYPYAIVFHEELSPFTHHLIELGLKTDSDLPAI